MPRKPRRAAARKPPGKAVRKTPFEALQVALGDRIRVERRFVVEGKMQRVADKGVFHGVQAMGSIEHILLESGGEVHLIPLPSVSEIVLVEAESKRHGAMGLFDPSFA